MTHIRWRWLAPLAALAIIAGTGAASAASASPAPVKPAHPIKGVYLHVHKAGKTGAPKITIPASKRGTINRSGGGQLLWHGGPVQRDPQVFVIYWGLWWASTCSGQLGNGGADEGYLGAFYNGLGTGSDNEAPIASQYYGPTGNYPLYPTLAGHALITENVYCDGAVPASATDAQLAAVAVAYASYLASNGYTITNNTQIVVVSPSGTNPGGGFGSQYCAYHNWTSYSGNAQSGLLSWTNLPYMPDQGGNCGANFVQNSFDGWSIVGGHEFTESVTDPFVNNQSAWYDNAGFEIGDKCAWQGLFAQSLSTGSFAEQPEWDNRTAACQAGFTFPHGNIKSHTNAALCLSSGAVSNNPVTLRACDSSSARIFARFTDKSLRRWKNTGMCLRPQGGSSAAGTPIVVYRCNEVSNQQWTWSSVTRQWKNGYGKCLDAPTQASGAAVIENTCSTALTQQFSNV